MEVIVQWGSRANGAGARLWNSLGTQAALADAQGLEGDAYTFSNILRRDGRTPRLVAVGTGGSGTIIEDAGASGSAPCSAIVPRGWQADCALPMHSRTPVFVDPIDGLTYDSRESIMDAARVMAEEADTLTGGLRVCIDAADSILTAACREVMPEMCDDLAPRATRTLVWHGDDGGCRRADDLALLCELAEFSDAIVPVSLLSPAHLSIASMACAAETWISPSVIPRLRHFPDVKLSPCYFALDEDPVLSVFARDTPWPSPSVYAAITRDARDPLYASSESDPRSMRTAEAVLRLDLSMPGSMHNALLRSISALRGDLRESLERLLAVD